MAIDSGKLKTLETALRELGLLPESGYGSVVITVLDGRLDRAVKEESVKLR